MPEAVALGSTTGGTNPAWRLRSPVGAIVTGAEDGSSMNVCSMLASVVGVRAGVVPVGTLLMKLASENCGNKEERSSGDSAMMSTAFGMRLGS